MIGICFLICILNILNTCSKSSSIGDNQGANDVFIQGMVFSPFIITVAVGTTITWTNKDGVAHTVISNSGSFDSGSINPNGTYNHMFSTEGLSLTNAQSIQQ